MGDSRKPTTPARTFSTVPTPVTTAMSEPRALPSPLMMLPSATRTTPTETAIRIDGSWG